MNKPKAVTLDIDDTLLDFVSHLCDIHNGKYDTNYSLDDVTDWNLPQDLRNTFEDYENWIYISQPILPEVREKLAEFRGKGYKIILMTARSEDYRKHTEFNLAFNKIKYDELHFNKNKSLKINRLSEKYDIIAFADDKIETVNKVKRDTDVPNVYLINNPANRNKEEAEGVIRINNIFNIKEV